jgi:3-hydroxyacyl-CoA dehydrogenase
MRLTRPARNAFAQGAIEKLKKAKPAAFTHVRNAILIQTGNFDDDLGKVADCDIIIEAIIERLDLKQALFEKLERIAAAHAICVEHVGSASPTCSSGAPSSSARTSVTHSSTRAP